MDTSLYELTSVNSGAVARCKSNKLGSDQPLPPVNSKGRAGATGDLAPRQNVANIPNFCRSKGQFLPIVKDFELLVTQAAAFAATLPYLGGITWPLHS